MGLDIVLGAGQLALGLAQAANAQKAADAQAKASGIQAKAYDAQAKAAEQQYKDAIKGQTLLKQSAATEKRANAIQGAQQEVTALEDRRSQVRELRLRQAQLASASENSGGAGSSAAAGASSALTTNFNRTIGLQMGETRTNRALNAARQRSVNLQLGAQLLASQGEANAAKSAVGAAKANAEVARAGVVSAQVQGQNAFLNVFAQGIGTFGDIIHNHPNGT